MSEDVRGWCLGRDSAGVPTLSECALMTGVQGRYFAVAVDREGNPITVRTYQRGETFFTSRLEALEAWKTRLSDLRFQHAGLVRHLDEMIGEVHKMLEKEAGDAGR